MEALAIIYGGVRGNLEGLPLACAGLACLRAVETGNKSSSEVQWEEARATVLPSAIDPLPFLHLTPNVSFSCPAFLPDRRLLCFSQPYLPVGKAFLRDRSATRKKKILVTPFPDRYASRIVIPIFHVMTRTTNQMAPL